MASITLRNGVQMPSVGLGTYKAKGDEVINAVCYALQQGIRHIDTASIYRNEEQVAEGIAKSGVHRKDIFVCSKLSPGQQGTEKATQGCQDMITKLGGAPVDLALIHWPGASGNQPDSADNARLRLETWRVMEDMYEQGLFRSIGVSNFEITHLEEMLKVVKTAPMVNQIEVHPRRPSTALRAYCQQQGIVVVAYSPLGQGQLIEHPVVHKLAAQYGKTPAQVLLQWGLSKGYAVIPKSVTPERIAQFCPQHLQGWSLSAESSAELDALEDNHKYCWDPQTVT